jgi:hypothetical protein
LYGAAFLLPDDQSVRPKSAPTLLRDALGCTTLSTAINQPRKPLIGARLAVCGRLPETERARRLEHMADISPYRGELRMAHHPQLSIGIQTRGTDASLDDSPALTVAVHGRAYDWGSTASASGQSLSASTVARTWAQDGADCLARLDWEFSLLVYDKRQALSSLSSLRLWGMQTTAKTADKPRDMIASGPAPRFIAHAGRP